MRDSRHMVLCLLSTYLKAGHQFPSGKVASVPLVKASPDLIPGGELIIRERDGTEMSLHQHTSLNSSVYH